MSAPRVVVIGGHGYFGRLVVDDLLESTDAHIAIAGRRPALQPHWSAERVSLVRLDQHDRITVRSIARGAAAVVHSAGPYQHLDPTVLHDCIEVGTPYVDLADDRLFVRRAEQVAREASRPTAPIFIGMSFVPALCALLAEHVRGELYAIRSVRCTASPGSRGSRGRATLDSLLSHAGRRFTRPTRDGESSVWGWSRPTRAQFPPPIHERTSYTAIPVADFDLYARWFGCEDVEFRACSDLVLLDRALWLTAMFQRLVPVPVLRHSGSLMVGVVRMAGRFGTDAATGMVELSNGERTVRAAVVAKERGERLPALPAAMVVADLLGGRSHHGPGLVEVNRAIPAAVFASELARRGITTWRDFGRGWAEVRP